MYWNGRKYRPVNQINVPKNAPFNFEEALKPLGEKEVPVWVSNIYKAPETAVPVSPTPTPTNTNTPTPSITPSNSPGVTPTNTPSQTATNTPTNTPSQTPSNTPSVTPSITASNTPTPSITASVTPSVTPSITPSITPSSSPIPSGTTEANAFLSAVVSAGGTLNSTISGATVTLFTSLVSNGLWDKITQFYPLIGATGPATAIEGKSATSKITWNGGMTFTSSGAKSNGTNAYGNIAYNDSTQGTLNSFHFSFYSNQDLGGDAGLVFGVLQGTHQNNLYLDDSSNESGIKLQTSGAYAFASDTDTLGFYVATRTTDVFQRLYKNGTAITSNTATSTGRPNANQYVFARNNTGVGTDAYTNKRGAFISIGSALTQTDVTNLQNAVHTFNTTLGRNY